MAIGFQLPDYYKLTNALCNYYSNTYRKQQISLTLHALSRSVMFTDVDWKLVSCDWYRKYILSLTDKELKKIRGIGIKGLEFIHKVQEDLKNDKFYALLMVNEKCRNQN